MAMDEATKQLQKQLVTAALPAVISQDWTRFQGSDDQLVAEWAKTAVNVADKVIKELESGRGH